MELLLAGGEAWEGTGAICGVNGASLGCCIPPKRESPGWVVADLPFGFALAVFLLEGSAFFSLALVVFGEVAGVFVG